MAEEKFSVNKVVEFVKSMNQYFVLWILGNILSFLVIAIGIGIDDVFLKNIVGVFGVLCFICAWTTPILFIMKKIVDWLDF
jgi:succinate-acetate transporter protein